MGALRRREQTREPRAGVGLRNNAEEDAMNCLVKIASILMAWVSFSAQAQPIATPGTEGFSVIVNTTGQVLARYEGNSAAFSNDLYLGSSFIFNNHATAVGTEVLLGSFAAGTELIFRLHVNNTGFDYFTGPAARNPDNHTHARVQSDWQTDRALVSFEDLFNGPFDYNDLSFSFTNTRGTPVVPSIPEPQTYALMLAGLGCIALAARRRRR
jgi:hypothetical protein